MTKKFIQIVKTYFKTLNYEPKDLSLDFNAFKKSAYQSICYSKDNDSLRASIYMYRYCSDKWSKIEKIFSKPRLLSKFQKISVDYFSDYYSFVYKRRKKQSYRYILTNNTYKNQIICFYQNDCYELKKDSKNIYFVKVGNNKYKLIDKGYKGTTILNENGNLICNAFYNASKFCLDLFKNISPYDIVPIEDNKGNHYMGIYKKSNSLKASILVAIIDFGYFSDKRPDSFASLEMYENDEDESLLMCFALSFIISTYNNVKHYQTMLLLYSCSKI